MAGLVFRPKDTKNLKFNDPMSPYYKPVAGFVGDMVKDTAVSAGQIANESANRGMLGLTPAGLLARYLFGKDYLANAAGRIDPRIGESMRGEVTPMDVVNVASLIPIPAGSGVRAGLLALKLGSKSLPRVLKGGKYAEATNIPIKPSIVARIAERTMLSPFTEGIAEGALNAPFVPQVWENNDLSTEAKIGLTAAMLSGVVSPSIARGIKKTRLTNKRISAAKTRIKNGQATPVDWALVNANRTKSSDSDLTLSLDTKMPNSALAALTIGQSGDAFSHSVRLYETDATFKEIIDDVSSGRITASEATQRYNTWKNEILPGSRPPFIPQHSFSALENKVKTGRLSSKTTGNVYDNVRDPFKIDRFQSSLDLSPVPGGVGDTRDIRLYDALVASGEIKGTPIGGPGIRLAQRINAARTRKAMRELDDWIKNTYGISTPARLAAVRERLYQGIGHSGKGLEGRIF